MEIVSHEDIRMRIVVQLTVQSKHIKRELGLAGREEQVADAIMRGFAGTVTVAPDMVDGGYRRGVFGRDEPHPFPGLGDPPPPPPAKGL